MKKVLFICVTMLLICISGKATERNLLLIPYPQQVSIKQGNYNLTDNVKIGAEPLFTQELKKLQEVLTEDFGLKSQIVKPSKADISLCYDASFMQEEKEAYQLEVTDMKITIRAQMATGIFYGIQSLRQLIKSEAGKWIIPKLTITDYPALSWRSFMLDEGRYFKGEKVVKQILDEMALLKMNVFQWHLTDDQGWRIEIKKYPRLTEIGAFRDSTQMEWYESHHYDGKPHGGFYTQTQIRSIIKYASERHITIIPEIEMPGHSAAFIRTFRHDMQSPEGMKILKLLMDEVCETFDVPYLHIGTDEVQFTNPRFVPEMVSYVRSKGKKVISWNPGWHYKPGEIDMTQLWSYRGKAQKGIPAIDSRFHYLNHFDTFGDIIALYNSRIYNKEQGSEDLAGTILAIWNDRLVSTEWGMIIENNFYPNMLAMAERAWKGGGTEYFDKNGTILPTDEHSELFRSFADFERRLLWHKEHTFDGYPFAYVRQTNVKWNITDAFPNEGNLAKAFPPEETLQDSYSYGGKTYNVRPAIGAGIYLRHVWGTLIPGFYKEPKENHTAYAYTYVYSPKEQNVGLWAEFQNYGRSEADLPPLPGKWDYKESRIWINEQEILPPVWTATHRTKSNEIALGNENCVARPPLEVHLQKGWNKVLLKLPVGKFVSPEVRLVKWMFTTVFVTLDGQKAVEGLIYSPNKTLE